jgi:hypothetical protein
MGETRATAATYGGVTLGAPSVRSDDVTGYESQQGQKRLLATRHRVLATHRLVEPPDHRPRREMEITWRLCGARWPMGLAQVWALLTTTTSEVHSPNCVRSA